MCVCAFVYELLKSESSCFPNFDFFPRKILRNFYELYCLREAVCKSLGHMTYKVCFGKL